MSTKVPIPRLQVITDEEIQDCYTHVHLAELAFRGGADAVQFREKRQRTTRALVDSARGLLEVAHRHRRTLIVDDRPDIALAIAAPAVHLGREDLDVATARRILGPEAVIGGTANSFEEAERVWMSGVDYLGVGPVYGTKTKRNPAPTMGLDMFARICGACPIPVVGIGSITAERIPDVLDAGAHGVAVVSYAIAAPDVEAAVRECRSAVDAGLARSIST